MIQLRQHRIIVTGGAGFLGRAVATVLRARGVDDSKVFIPRRRDYDLTTDDGCRRLYTDAFPGAGPSIVIHAAGFTGGIGRNRRHPARFFMDNILMSLNLVRHAEQRGLIERGLRVLQVGTMCSYPAEAPIPYHEESLWKGYPDAVSAPYGVAKLCAWQLLDAYRMEHGLKSAYVIPVNLYGPGDNIADPENSHVAGALIRKFVEASMYDHHEVVCWGSGAPTRDFLYVDDAAEGVVRAAEVMDDPIPINLASGKEVSIRELAETIARLTGFRGRITWDHSRPDGQPHRSLDISRAKKLLAWEPKMDLREGLKRTVEWYRSMVPA
ncbi:MAG: NAD-dependent epimerase/dehydratase family protein [Dehalococcoidia bacterium]|nr:NAD-dependent epimerase/dehydratase family protein [Dehalococcoidia bacterium]